MEILNAFDNDLEDIVRNNSSLISKETENTKLILFNDDFLKHSWAESSFIFANSTCFSPDLMESLANKAEEEIKKGAFFITFTKKLPFTKKENWEIKPGFRRVMSWGIATIFIHRKIN